MSSKGFFQVPIADNEPINTYAPGTAARAELQAKLRELKSKKVDLPMVIGGREIRTGDKREIRPPHEHKHLLGHFNYGNDTHVKDAIEAALAAKEQWEAMSWENRASIFLKAADLIAGPYRAEINAATMLGQSKNAFQAEIDSACELIDFLRFNVQYMSDMYENQAMSSDGVLNRTEYRPLEGFVLAITPFNFTAIAGNLPTAPAMVGNTVVWKPADTQVYAAAVIMRVLEEAGLPAGVINLVYADGPMTGEITLNSPDLAGVHFTGSTATFKHIWRTLGQNIDTYRSYPRLVGETGGKDFVLAHKSAKAKELAVGLIRGAYEFQGQKCSAASRAYIPSNLWPQVREYMAEDLQFAKLELMKHEQEADENAGLKDRIKGFISKAADEIAKRIESLDDYLEGNMPMKIGKVDDFTNFINAVIDEKAFDKITGYIERAKKNPKNEIVFGGNYDKSEGYFIEPTVILTTDPKSETMVEEIFGPVLTIYVYDENEDWEKILELVDSTSPYGLTGGVFSQDRYALETAAWKLRHAAGNFYFNDKPTGAVVGQQPFGGGRASGTNDKAGSMQNLLRWVSPRSIKETLVPATEYSYPFQRPDVV